MPIVKPPAWWPGYRRDNPLSLGLEHMWSFALPAATIRPLIGPSTLTSSAGTWGGSAVGLGYRPGFAEVLLATDTVALSYPCTLAWVMSWKPLTTFRIFFQKLTSSSTNFLRSGNATTTLNAQWRTEGDSFSSNLNVTGLTVGQIYTVVLEWGVNGNTSIISVSNADFYGSASESVRATGPIESTGFVSWRANTIDATSLCDIYLWCVWNRWIGSDAVALFHRDPFSILQPSARTEWLAGAVAAGGGASIAPHAHYYRQRRVA